MSGADTLPTGATAALLCFHDNRYAWVPPHGRLAVGLDDLVRVVNAQRAHDPNSEDSCAGVGAPGWTVVLRYADGTRSIQGDNGGCWDLAVGSTERFGATSVWHADLAALLRQREQQGTPDTAPDPRRDASRRSVQVSPPAAPGRHRHRRHRSVG
jgi:hypothetical protein